MAKLSAKTFSGEHSRLSQASVLVEAASPVSSVGSLKVFLFLRKQFLLSQVLLFGLYLALKKKAKDAGGWHSWFPGRGSNPCGVFACCSTCPCDGCWALEWELEKM